MVSKYRIRLKAKSYVVEKLIDGKVKKSLTLNPLKTYDMLMCQDINTPNVSKPHTQPINSLSQKFGQGLLSELPKEDTKKKLWELTKWNIK